MRVMDAIPPCEMRIPPRVGPTMYDLQLGRHDTSNSWMKFGRTMRKLIIKHDDI